MQALALARGGKFESNVYSGLDKKYPWSCVRGHTWEARAANVVRGGWCPYCKSSIGERLCRIFFESLFDAPFKKCRPEWLLNTRGNKMELDGYNVPLSIAFEYNGTQHISPNNPFLGAQEFATRQQDDNLKIELCEQFNVALFIIPQFTSKDFKHDGLVRLLLDLTTAQNQKFKLQLPSKDEKNFDLNKAYLYHPLKELQNLAAARGGKCLSTDYLGNKVYLKWECKKGHQWEAPPYRITRGCWCMECFKTEDASRIAIASSVKRLSITDAQMAAQVRGGVCLSTNYLNNKQKLTWKCSKGFDLVNNFRY